MTSRSLASLVVLLLALPAGLTMRLSASNVPSSRNDPGDNLFGDTISRSFKIEIATADIESLKQDSRRYVRAVVREGAAIWRDVGVRLTGQSTFRPVELKPNLAVNFHRFVSGQRYDGLSKFFLHNAVQDGTYLHEFLATGLLRDASVPVPRVTHARVELNGRDLGLYVLVEAVNKEFLRRHFDGAEGNLYEGCIKDIDQALEQDNGQDLSQDDLRNLVAAAKTRDPTKRVEQLNRYLDVDRFLRFIALEMFLGHTDGYVMSRNNYRIYCDPITGKASFIAHGLDGTFINGVSLRPPNQTLLVKALFEHPDVRFAYRGLCGELVTNLWQSEVLTKRIDSAVARMLTVAKDEQERSRWQNLGRGMSERVLSRERELKNLLAEPDPEPIKFDSKGVARLSGWSPRIQTGTPSLHQIRERGTNLLYMQAGHQHSVSSWCTRALVPKGRFAFLGKARSKGVRSDVSDSLPGVTLRLSNVEAGTALQGDSDWRELMCEIEAPLGDIEVELICELRATEGEAWFEAESLRLERLPAVDLSAP